jgi:large subunit ribosomal protein L2
MLSSALKGVASRLLSQPAASGIRSMALLPRMARVGDLKSYKPTSPGRRHRVVIDKAGLWRGGPEPSLTYRITGQQQAGRNNTGRITTWHRMAPKHRRQYRIIDFHRKRTDPATVERLEYDPNRSAFIALIKYMCAASCHIRRPHDQPF